MHSQKKAKKSLSQLLATEPKNPSGTMLIPSLEAAKKVWLCVLAVSLIFATIAQAQKPQEKAALHTWTSLTGHQIIAEFVEIKGEDLFLKDEGGVKRIIRLPMLIPTDQALAKKLEDQPKGGAQTKGSAPNVLPVFIAGEAKSYHAVYTHENFIAKVTRNGLMTIQCMESGEPVGEPIPFNFSHRYITPKPLRTHNRPIVQFDKFPAPTTSPTLLEYEATLVDDVKIGINYAFIDNTIQIGFWVIDPPRISYPTIMHCALGFRASHTFAPETTVPQQKKILQPYTLVVHQKNKGIVRLPYADIVSQFPGSVQQVTIEGPVFGRRSVSVAVQSQKTTHLGLMHYRDFAPYQGYSVGFGKANLASKSAFERFIITID